jgi:hypothetical protein
MKDDESLVLSSNLKGLPVQVIRTLVLLSMLLMSLACDAIALVSNQVEVET